MFAFLPTGLASWEIVAFSALCAMIAFGIGTAITVTVVYFATCVPRAARQPAAACVPQPQYQPTGVVAART